MHAFVLHFLQTAGSLDRTLRGEYAEWYPIYPPAGHTCRQKLRSRPYTKCITVAVPINIVNRSADTKGWVTSQGERSDIIMNAAVGIHILRSFFGHVLPIEKSFRGSRTVYVRRLDNQRPKEGRGQVAHQILAPNRTITSTAANHNIQTTAIDILNPPIGLPKNPANITIINMNSDGTMRK